MTKLCAVLAISFFAASADAGMLISNDGQTHFGDIERSGGVDGNRGRLFDEELGTSAYRESASGYAGVSLGAPTTIEGLEFVSQINGFDAFGISTTITLNAYCKTTTGAPANASDGTLVGTLTFSDSNVLTTKFVPSNNPSLGCRYVWGQMTTGVWSALTELRVYGSTSPEVVATDTGTVFRKSCNERAKLNYTEAEFSCFRQAFELNEARTVLLDFHGGFVHTGTANYGTASFTGVVGVGVRAIRRWASTQAGVVNASWQEDANMIATGNIYDLTQHYIHLPITGCWELPAGFHEVSIMASNHTDAVDENDVVQLGILTVLAEGSSPPYSGRNLLRIHVLPVGSSCNGG